MLIVGFHLISYFDHDKLQPATIANQPTKDPVKGQRQVDFAEAGIHTTTIYDGDLLYAHMPTLHGPAIIEDSGATVVICPGMSAEVDDYGNVLINTES